MIRSSNSEQCESQATISGGALTLLPNSIVTLYGAGFDPPAAVQNRARVPALPAFTSAGTRSVRVFGLNGRGSLLIN